MSNMRTPLSRVRGLGSARDGTQAFWMQRLTSVANIPLTLIFVGLLVAISGADFATTRSILANPIVALLLLAAIFSVLYHMRIGMQVVIEDYVQAEFPKIVLIMLNQFFVYGVGGVSAFALLKLAFGY